MKFRVDADGLDGIGTDREQETAGTSDTAAQTHHHAEPEEPKPPPPPSSYSDFNLIFHRDPTPVPPIVTPVVETPRDPRHPVKGTLIIILCLGAIIAGAVAIYTPPASFKAPAVIAGDIAPAGKDSAPISAPFPGNFPARSFCHTEVNTLLLDALVAQLIRCDRTIYVYGYATLREGNFQFRETVGQRRAECVKQTLRKYPPLTHRPIITRTRRGAAPSYTDERFRNSEGQVTIECR